MKQFRRVGKMGEGKEASLEGRRIRRRVVKETEGPEEFDWESEDGGGPPVVGESLRSLRPILFGGLAVLILMLGLAVYVLLDQDGQAPGLDGRGQQKMVELPARGQQKTFELPAREFVLDPVEEIEITNLDTEMSKFEALVKKFLGAKTVEEVLATTRRDPVLQQKIKDYYRSHRLSPVLPKAVAPNGRILRNRGLWAVDVLLPDHSVKSIAAERLDDRYAIDWESWVGYSEIPWGEVRKIRPKEPTLFRVLCSPIQYYNYGFTDDGKWRSYRLQSPDRKHTLYGYVERLSIQESMLTRHDVKSDQSLAYILRIRFADDSGPDQVIIEEVVESGWVRTTSDESAPVGVLE